MYELNQLLENSKKASRTLSLATIEQKNQALLAIADGLEKDADDILRANAIDLENAKGKLGEVMLDRLALSKSRIKAMADGVREAQLDNVKLPESLEEIELFVLMV